jgi:hypothetical protein
MYRVRMHCAGKRAASARKKMAIRLSIGAVVKATAKVVSFLSSRELRYSVEFGISLSSRRPSRFSVHRLECRECAKRAECALRCHVQREIQRTSADTATSGNFQFSMRVPCPAFR